MDSLKLDRFKRLLNRQNTSINLGDGTNQGQRPQVADAAAASTNAASGRSVSAGGVLANSKQVPATVTTAPTQSSLAAITNNDLPEFILKDQPKPAHLITRKLFCDFTHLANNKIDTILGERYQDFLASQNHSKDSHQHQSGSGAGTLGRSDIKSARSLFWSLQRDQDLVYDQILRALGTASEYSLPSLLRYLLLWYRQQLEAYADTGPQQQLQPDDCTASKSALGASEATQQPDTSAINFQHSGEISSPTQEHLQHTISSSSSSGTTNNTCDQQQQQQQPQAAECGCTSPCNNESHSLGNSFNLTTNSNSLLRSTTPNSPDISGNQILITSSLPLDYQTPSPVTTVIQKQDKDEQQQQQQQQSSASAANTSTSTANTNTSLNSTSFEDSLNMSKRLELTKTRALLVEYCFCQALIEIFGKLYLHPGHEDLIGQVENIAFEHFRHVEEQQVHGSIELASVKRLAEKYAQVVGVLAQTRFKSVKKRFFSELSELRTKEPTTYHIQCICALLAGMNSFRIKMAPIEEFEASFQFLQELAYYFVEVRHKSVKHALADLFVEMLLPVASMVKNEVKIPCLKNFVDTLWAPTLDMCARKKHSPTLFPLVTCLLCVSQRAVFLQNWSPFLNMCLSNLKNRDQKMCKIALESLYRLIWIYMIRVKGESNNITQIRLNAIVDALFPRGSRQIVPRETPLVIFIDIIQFIAHERLDFALRHIIFELLSVDRSIKMIMAPERMNIGLQAFLVIADNLQQKESETTMPISIGSASAQQLVQIMHTSLLPSSASFMSSNNQQLQTQHQQHDVGATCGIRRAHRMLNDDTAKSIGLHPYYTHIQKSFNEILKVLDAQFGRPLMLTSGSTAHKDLDDVIGGERRLKVDLFKTCIAAIPRLMPDGMSKSDLIDLLARMTIHIDEEMRKYAFETLQKLVTEFQDWRLDAIEGFTLFLANQIDESLRNLVDSALKMLLQLLISWHTIITSSSSSSSHQPDSDSLGSKSSAGSVVTIQTGYETISSRNSGTGGQIVARKNRALAEMRLIQSELSNTRFDRLVNVIQKVEGASFVMLCSCHNTTRKLASLLLRECRAILRCYSSWTCMEQFGFRSPDDEAEEELSVSLKGSLSADNLSRITTTSFNGLVASSMTSMNTQSAMLSTSISKMCISSGQQQPLGGGNTSNQQHDLYDEDIENHLGNSYSNDENSTLMFWFAVMMLDSARESEHQLGLRLLRKILPNMPFEQEDFLDELERNLKQMEWIDYPGIHALVLRGCSSANYDLCISLLDHMTPILKHNICTANGGSAGKTVGCLPAHVLMLSTYLLSTYEDPPACSLNIARRIALCCEENLAKPENLSAVMTLYSRRSFSKDAFQWIKCVVKYLHDACPTVLPTSIPLLLDLLEGGPAHIQRLILPLLYCILTYVDLTATSSQIDLTTMITRLYNKSLGCEHLWRDASQIFRLIISKSSSLANGTTGRSGHELPGRTMEFSLEIESVPIIAKSRLSEFGAAPNSFQVSSGLTLVGASSNSAVSPAPIASNTAKQQSSTTESQARE